MKSLKILHLTTHNEDCGIAKYNEQFIAALDEVGDVTNVIFPYSPNKIRVMSEHEFAKMFNDFRTYLKDAAILHVQHELSFYGPGQLAKLIREARRMGVKVLTTVHTAPSAAFIPAKLKGFGPRSVLHFLRQLRAAKKFIALNVRAYDKSDLILVHSDRAVEDLVSYGLSREKIKVIVMPVPERMPVEGETDTLKKHLRYEAGDIIIGLVGFLSKSKGAKDAVKALRLLPKNYKLAVIGGVHPFGDSKIIDDVMDLAIKLNVEDRVYITGYIEEDGRLHTMIKEADVCVYPYSKKYYSYVSSAAITLALADGKATVSYPVGSFIALNKNGQVTALTKSCNYYELARALTEANFSELSEAATEYARRHSYSKEATTLKNIYLSVL